MISQCNHFVEQFKKYQLMTHFPCFLTSFKAYYQLLVELITKKTTEVVLFNVNVNVMVITEH